MNYDKLMEQKQGEDLVLVPEWDLTNYNSICEYQAWGWCPTYKHKETGKLLFCVVGKGYIDVVDMISDLELNWRPVGRDAWFKYTNSIYQLKETLKKEMGDGQ